MKVYEEEGYDMATPKVRGLHTWRFKSNPEEERFALAWEKSNKEGNTLAYLLDTLQKGIPLTPSVRDQEVAATLIQWLGSQRNALYSAGYTDVALTGYAYFGCGKDDTFATGFRAKNPQGNRVEGVVCCGFVGKGCTIRF